MTLRESIAEWEAAALQMVAAERERMLAGLDMSEGVEGAGAAFLDGDARYTLAAQRHRLAREEMDRLWLAWATRRLEGATTTPACEHACPRCGRELAQVMGETWCDACDGPDQDNH